METKNKKILKMSGADAAIEDTKIRSLYEYISDIITLEFFKSSNKKVAVLRLEGVIGKGTSRTSTGLSLDSLNSMIEKCFNTPKLDAVILAINSPGGSPVQSELIASRIINLSKDKKIPVYSFIEDVGASGGYWLACAGKEIYASKSSIIGSIGVVSRGFGFASTIEKLGIERRVHTAGKNKSVLDPFMPEKKTDIDIIKKIQLSIHEHFIDYVKTRRIGKLTQNDEIIFTGEFWCGEIAKDFGLIDGIDDVYSFIKRKFGDKTKIEYIAPKESWLKKKFGISMNSDELAKAAKNEILNMIEEIDITSKYNLK
jgi:signal peptide peptidase SppA